MSKPRLVIVGGGFAGCGLTHHKQLVAVRPCVPASLRPCVAGTPQLTAALPQACDVTLIDTKDYFEVRDSS